MKRLGFAIALVALFGLVFAPSALACGKNAGGCPLADKNIEKKVENTKQGVRVTLAVGCPTHAANLAKEIAAQEPCDGGCPLAAKGVTRTVKADGPNVVIELAAKDPAGVRALQKQVAMATSGKAAPCPGCAKGNCPRHAKMKMMKGKQS